MEFLLGNPFSTPVGQSLGTAAWGARRGPGEPGDTAGASAGGRGWRQRGALGVAEGLWGPWGSVRGCGSGGGRVCESPCGKSGLGEGLWGLVEVLGGYGDHCGLIGVVGQLWGLWRCRVVSGEQGCQGFQGLGGAGRRLGSAGGLSAGLWG